MERHPALNAAGNPHAIDLKSVLDLRLTRDLKYLIFGEER
jgi:hypothetical protein